jgi:hypothetical protein
MQIHMRSVSEPTSPSRSHPDHDLEHGSTSNGHFSKQSYTEERRGGSASGRPQTQGSTLGSEPQFITENTEELLVLLAYN